MILYFLRGVFVLVLATLAMSYISSDLDPSSPLRALQYYKQFVLIGILLLGVAIIAVDVFIPQKSLVAISGLFFGVMVGMLLAYGVSLIINLGVQSFYPDLRQPVYADVSVDRTLYNPEATRDMTPVGRQRVQEKQIVAYRDHPFVSTLKIIIGVICCYLAVSFILQTKDDVRFVIPYVEFARQTKGSRPMLLDTSVIIDGRIADIAETGVVEAELVVPRFVLQELQLVADSGDKLKRNRGRRGLDILNKMQLSDKIDIQILDVRMERSDRQRTVDEMLVELGSKMNGRLVTNDYNLNKVAQVRGVPVININDLANAVKPIFLPGEGMKVRIIKPGEESGQGVGYLDDGTMVVAEGCRDHIGETVDIAVTSVLQTSAGRMIFGRLEGMPPPRRGGGRHTDRNT